MHIVNISRADDGYIKCWHDITKRVSLKARQKVGTRRELVRGIVTLDILRKIFSPDHRRHNEQEVTL